MARLPSQQIRHNHSNSSANESKRHKGSPDARKPKCEAAHRAFLSVPPHAIRIRDSNRNRGEDRPRTEELQWVASAEGIEEDDSRNGHSLHCQCNRRRERSMTEQKCSCDANKSKPERQEIRVHGIFDSRTDDLCRESVPDFG